MAITEADLLCLRDEKKRAWLLLKSERQFHLVRADAGLTGQKYDRLLKRYPCNTKTFQELGISVTPLNRDKCTHAIFEGVTEGEKLTLWFSGDVRTFTLGDSYTRERLEAFFDRQDHRWDLAEVPEGPDGKLTRIIGWSINGITFGLLLSALAGRFFPWLTLLVFGATAALCILWPGRFLTEEQRGGGDRRVIRVWMELSLIGPPLVMLLEVMDHAVYRRVIPLMIWGAALGLVIGMVILWRSRAYRNEGIWLLIGLMLVSSGPLAQVNQLLDFGPTTSYTVTVEEMEESRQFRGGTSYYCHVIMPEGQQEQFAVSRDQFLELEAGDRVEVVIHEGALGFEYMTISLDNEKSDAELALHRFF